MKKEIKVRFYLDRPEHRELWDWLNAERDRDGKSINDIVLDALTEYRNPRRKLAEEVADFVEERIRKLLSSGAVLAVPAAQDGTEELDEEINLDYFD